MNERLGMSSRVRSAVPGLLAAAIGACLFGSFCCACFCYASTGPEADKLAAEGMRLVREDHVEQGIDLLVQASRSDPNNASLHVKLGGLLYEYAQSLFGSGDSLRAQTVLRDAERELRAAVDLLPSTEASLRADCAFLIGEIYTRGYGYHEAAKRWYEQALAENPKHTGARDALQRLEQFNRAIASQTGP